VRLEQASIEERNRTESDGGSGASRFRPVQGAEEKGSEKISVYSAATPQAAVNLIGQEPLTTP
jgi:hypothetical protein